MEIVAKAPADGYTMLIASPSSQSVNPVINKNLGYVPERDFTGAAAARAQAADGQGRHRRGGLEVAGGVRSLHAREREALAAAREGYRREGGLEDETGNVRQIRSRAFQEIIDQARCLTYLKVIV